MIARIAGALVLLIAAAVLDASAQSDPGKALKGTWTGELGPLVGVKDPDEPRRTLVIDSVSRQEGKWIARGRFGIPGKTLGRVPIEVDAAGARPSLKFALPSGAVVRLDLMDARNLTGTMTYPGSGPRERVRALKLAKAE